MTGLRSVLARRVLRAGSGHVALVVLVIGLMGGAALFAAAGGRRASTAFDRFVDWSQPPHVETGGYGGDAPIAERLDEVAALPSVTASTRTETVVAAGVEIAPGRVLDGPRIAVVAPATDAVLDERGRVLVLEGALPDPTSTSEAVIDFGTAETLDLAVGDRVRLLAGEDGDQPFRIEIAAIISHPSTFPAVGGWRFNALILMPGFVRAHPDLVDPWASSLAIWLREGPDAVDQLRTEIARLGLTDLDLPSGIASVRDGPTKITRIEAVGLWAAAGVAAAAGLVVAYQLLRRGAMVAASAAAPLEAFGVRRRELVEAAMLRGAGLGLLAASVATVVGVAASPLAPIGLARLAEVDPGVHVDLTVLAAGVGAIVVFTTLASAVATLLAFSPRRTAPTARRHTLAGAGPVVASGVGLALGSSHEVRRGSRGMMLGGAVVTAAAAVIVPVVAFGLDGVVHHPERTGGMWDAFAHVDDPSQADALEQALRGVPEVDDVTPGGWIPLQSGDEFVFATLFEPGQGIEPAVVRGRTPRTASEVALGAAAMHRLGVGLGDTLPLTTAESEQPAVVPVEVVGEVITSATLFQAYEPDDGVVLPHAFVEEWAAELGGSFLVTFDDGVDPEAGFDAVRAGARGGVLDFGFARSARADLLALRTLRTLASGLGALLLALLALLIAHVLLVGTRQHRTQLAVLRSLGMTARQIRGIGAVHGAVLVVAVVGLGLLLGTSAGAVAWRAVAGSLVVLPTLSWEVGTLAAGASLAVVSAVVVGWVATVAPSRRPPATTLRVE